MFSAKPVSWVDGRQIAPGFALLVKHVAKTLPVYQELQMHDGRPFTMGARVAGSVEYAASGTVDIPNGVLFPFGTNAEFIPWSQWRTTC
jgi:hypothetical protein